VKDKPIRDYPRQSATGEKTMTVDAPPAAHGDPPRWTELRAPPERLCCPVDTLTAANLFIGHFTGAILLALFFWLFVSDVLFSRGVKRRQPRPANARRSVRPAETVTVPSTK
jgi:hypothetical protein